MSIDLLTQSGRTSGSQAAIFELKEDVRIQPRAGMVRQSLAVGPLLLEFPSSEENLWPLQSAADSPIFWLINDYFFKALASIEDLASESLKRMRVISSPEARAANMDPWAVKNGRRIRLIEKKHGEGLTQREAIELARLKREYFDHMQTTAPRSTEALDRIDARIGEIKKRVEAKRGKKA